MVATERQTLARADRAIVTLRNMRAKARLNMQRTYGMGAALAGAAAAGAADAYLDEPKVVGFPATPLASAGLMLLGLFDVVPGAEYIAQAGLGGACYSVGALTFKKVNEFEE
jgi:hypothetical protein